MSDDKGKCIVPKWVAWCTVLLLIVAIVLAIVLPLTLGDDECTEIVRITHVWEKNFLVEPFDVVEADEPLADVPASVASLFDAMSSDNKVYQTQQYSYGDLSGLPIQNMDIDEMEELAREKKAGSYLNVVNRDDIKKIQDAAMESDPKIPILFAFDVVHGHHTVFPVNIGIAATWSRELVKASSRIAALEAAADGIVQTFAPMLDIARDPRWGRISESFGEDQYLTGELGVAFVEGFQENGVAACVKHFAAYGAGQAGRDYSTAQLGKAYVWNDYLPAYKKALDAGALTAMASFNTIEGVPSHANRELLTDLARGEWGWDGMIVGDYGGIRELKNHGVVADEKDGAFKAMTAGVDMSMADGWYASSLAEVLNQKDEFDRPLSEYVDLANKRILALKHKLNLFEKPLGPLSDEEAAHWNKPNEEALQVAEQTAAAAMVLLKNDKQTLPIAKTAKIGVLGRTHDSPPDMLGFWNGRGLDKSNCDHIQTFWDGIQAEFDDVTQVVGEKIVYFYDHDENGNIDDDIVDDQDLKCPRRRQRKNFPSANDISTTYKDLDYIIYVAGEGYMEHGEATSKTKLDLVDLEHVKEVAGARSANTKMVLVIIGGRQHTIEWEQETVLPDGRPAIDAIVQAWSPGTMAGPALAKLLTGEYVFSGRMPVTTPRNVGQVPIYYSQLISGRPAGDREHQIWKEQDKKWFVAAYMDSRTTPLYPFGYGLSYATFEYTNLQVTPTSADQHGEITITIDVTNQHETYTATEVVQLYLKRNVSTTRIAPPKKLLKGFERIEIKPKQTTTVTFKLNVYEDFGYYDNQLDWQVDPTEYTIFVAKDSDDESNAQIITIHQAPEEDQIGSI